MFNMLSWGSEAETVILIRQIENFRSKTGLCEFFATMATWQNLLQTTYLSWSII